MKWIYKEWKMSIINYVILLQILNNFHLVPVFQKLEVDVSTGDELRPFQLQAPTCRTVTA